jgi:hypothetical protein
MSKHLKDMAIARNIGHFEPALLGQRYTKTKRKTIAEIH